MTQIAQKITSFLVIITVFFFFVPLPHFVGATSICASYTSATDNDIFGNGLGQQQLAQPFTVSSTCTVVDIQAKLSTHNSPSDDVVIKLYTDSGGNPGSLIEAGSAIPSGSLTSTPTFVTSTFAGTTVLSPATTYWVYFDRSGSQDSSNNYFDSIGNASIPFPTYRGFNGVTWVEVNAGWDMDFIIDGNQAGGATIAFWFFGDF